MINEIDLDIVISELRGELDRIDRAILVFERLALEKKPVRRAISRTGSVRLKRSGASLSAQSSANQA
jgi:hypothetical protein